VRLALEHGLDQELLQLALEGQRSAKGSETLLDAAKCVCSGARAARLSSLFV
jgi:hypothetical protein